MIKEAVNKRVIETINLLIEQDAALNKSKLAQKFKISPSKFSEILNGRMAAGIDIMYHLNQDFQIDLNWLITGAGKSIGHTQIGDVNTIDNSPIHVNTSDEVDRLKSEIKHLEELLAAKDEIIKLLKTRGNPDENRNKTN